MQKCRAPSWQPWQPISPAQDERGPKACADVMLFYLAQCIFKLEYMSLVNENQEQNAGMFQCLEERASAYYFYVDIFCRFHEFCRSNSLSRLISQAVLHIFILTWQLSFQLGYSNRSNIDLQGETWQRIVADGPSQFLPKCQVGSSLVQFTRLDGASHNLLRVGWLPLCDQMPTKLQGKNWRRLRTCRRSSCNHQHEFTQKQNMSDYIVDNSTKVVTVELSGTVRDGPIYIACHVSFTRLTAKLYTQWVMTASWLVGKLLA